MAINAVTPRDVAKAEYTEAVASYRIRWLAISNMCNSPWSNSTLSATNGFFRRSISS